MKKIASWNTKKQSKTVALHAMVALRGRGGIKLPLILDFDTRYGE
jgi:hypothetical protein